MTKKELEKEIKNLKFKNEELKLNLHFATEIENETGFTLNKIIKLEDDSQIKMKIKNILLDFIKKHKELEQEKKILLKELTDSTQDAKKL